MRLRATLWTARLSRDRAIAVTASIALAGLLAPAVARAEDPAVTAQARMANAEFLAYAPPPEGEAGAVCLVDTGLDLNPDTEANVVERIALDDGDPGDVYESKHGTEMAMAMGGPVNEWGSIGIWPHVRIVSVRAALPGEPGFPFNYYTRAVIECARRVAARRVLVINLSLGGAGATQHEVETLRDRIRGAQRDGMSVVAAAGNAGAEIEYPAAIGEAFAAGAGDPAGGLCSFSARGAGLDAVAPGCGLDVALADGQRAIGSGTSLSSALVSAVLVALRSYRPDLGPLQAEELLLSTAQQTADGPALDVEAAFRAAGLGSIVDAGNTAVPPPPPPSSGGQDARGRLPVLGPAGEHLPTPRLATARYRAGRLLLRVANRPPDALVVASVIYSAARGEFRRRERTIERTASTLRLHVPRSWSRVKLEYRFLELEPSRSLVVTRRAVTRRVRSNKRPRR